MARYKLDGRVVAITGSTGGLGIAVAGALRQRGAKLALLGRDLDALALQARSLGGDDVAAAWQADVLDEASLAAAMAGATRHFGRLDIAFANAGAESLEPLVAMDTAAFARVIDVNLTGVLRTFKAALPHVRAQNGYLAVTSSMAAFVHSPLQSAYVASKAGVWAMCDSLRLELQHMGVGVGCYYPTFFDTPMLRQMQNDPAGAKVWGGNTSLLWQMVPKEAVVAAIVRGFERRAQNVVVPGRLAPVAMMPGLFRKAIEALGFPKNDVREAVDLVAQRK